MPWPPISTTTGGGTPLPLATKGDTLGFSTVPVARPVPTTTGGVEFADPTQDSGWNNAFPSGVAIPNLVFGSAGAHNISPSGIPVLSNDTLALYSGNPAGLSLPGDAAASGTIPGKASPEGHKHGRELVVVLTSTFNVANPAANTDQQIIALSIPANTLILGKSFEFALWGDVESNSTTALISVKYNSTLIVQVTLTAAVLGAGAVKGYRAWGQFTAESATAVRCSLSVDVDTVLSTLNPDDIVINKATGVAVVSTGIANLEIDVQWPTQSVNDVLNAYNGYIRQIA